MNDLITFSDHVICVVFSFSTSLITFLVYVCFIEACDMWHFRLGHVNKDCMSRMMDLELIPKLQNDIHEK